MKPRPFCKTLLILCLHLPPWFMGLAAETRYITSELQVGLHQDKSINSPIIQMVSSNTALDLIKQDETMSYVSTADGAAGWVDNSYLVRQPGTAAAGAEKQLRMRLADAETRIRQLQGELTGAGGGESNPPLQALRAENKTLRQEFKAERMKTGRLTVELASLRKRIGQNNDNVALYDELEQLQQDNKTLEIELARAMEMTQTGSGKLPELNAGERTISRADLLFYLLLVFVIGLGLGLYLMDMLARRRHGGFRV